MDNHRRSSIIESAGGYGQDTRSQLNTVRDEYFHF